MVTDLHERAVRLLNKAESAERFGPAASAIREATRLCELLGRLTGELQSQAPTNVTQVNFVGDPNWPVVRALMFRILAAHPELQTEFREGLRELASPIDNSGEGL